MSCLAPGHSHWQNEGSRTPLHMVVTEDLHIVLTLHRTGSLHGISMLLTETKDAKANISIPVPGLFFITHIADY